MPLALYDFSRLLKIRVPTALNIQSALLDICLGVQYLHSRNFVHGDIKPSNILLFKNGKKYLARITDFSISALCKDRIHNKLAYTQGFRPPEIEIEGSYSFKSDVWALGQVFKLLRPKFKELQTKSFDTLVSNMTCCKETERFTIQQVLESEFWEGMKFSLQKPKFYDLECIDSSEVVNRIVKKMYRLPVYEEEDFIEQEIELSEPLIHLFRNNIF
jgi:serine/threonine protein kinase